jgi:hypothetical protein
LGSHGIVLSLELIIQQRLGLVALAMLAMISTGFIWGWTCFAGLIALMWAGLLRPGGALSAVRADLLLLCDSDCSLHFALLFCKD